MFTDQDEPFCNPMAPVEHPTTSSSTSSDAASKIQNQNLSNEDFRKLIMTPSTNHVAPSTPAFGSAKFRATAVRGHRHQVIVTDEFKKPTSIDSQSDKKKNKKKYYQSKKEKDEDDEENLLAELMKKYRDRAKERRENLTETDDQLAKMGYNAVANLTSEDAAERRKQLIEESKYLGGDMEHTHLVKGLDYALLHKVKAELEFQRDQETLEMVENELAKSAENENRSDSDEEEQDWSIKSPLAQNIMKILFETNLPERNDYFLPGRLAYVFDLENDCPSDAYTTVIRSKAECPSWENLNTLSTSDIVLNKLIEIFEELREQGGRRKKKVKQSDQLKDNGKFSFINNMNDFGTSSVSDNSRTNSTRNDSSIRSTDLLSNDLNDVYDQDLNVEVIRKQGSSKIQKDDFNIYDDLDDYELPHHRLDKERNSSSSKSSTSRFDRDYDRHRNDRYRDDKYRDDKYRDDKYKDDKYRDDKYRDDKYRDDKYRDDKYRDNDNRYKRSSSRDRRRSSSSSDSSQDDEKYHHRRKEERSRKERTPEREDRHNRSHYSSSKKRRY